MKKFFYSAVLVSLVVTAIFFVTAFKSKSDNKVILSSKNTLTLRGEIDGNNVSKLIKEAIDLNAELEDGKPIYLVLDTPGGSIMDGYQFIDVLKSMGRPVHTISISSMSMGFQIVQALDRRYVFPSSVLMSHRANGSISGEFGGVKGSQLEKRLDFWNNIIDSFDMNTVKRTNGKYTLESYRQAYENELWLTGLEAVKEGFADEIVSAQCDRSLDALTEHEINFLGIRIVLKFSKCPLISSPVEMSVSKVRKNSVDQNSDVNGLPEEILQKIYEDVRKMYSLEGKISKARSLGAK